VSGAAWLAEWPSTCNVLRDYQRELLSQVATAFGSGDQRVLVQAPTGAGKTHVIAGLVACASQGGLRTLVLATRTRIVRQLHERLDAFRVPHGVIAAQLPELVAYSAATQVASVDTLYRRALVDSRMPLPAAELIVFDEAHLALGESRVALLEQYTGSQLVGFTATPAKVSGRALGELFERLILGPQVPALIAGGQLVRPRVFAAPLADQRELQCVAKDSKTGDYATGELSALLARPKLVGDVLTNWLRLANGKRTLVFACDKKHGAALLQEFLRAGVRAEMLTDQDSEPTREAAIERLETGETTVLLNCFLLSYGIDIPAVECVVLARPTRSVVLYLQAIGRGMRPAPGKSDVIVIDHGRVIESLGLPTQAFAWSLDDGTNVNRSAREVTARRDSTEKPRTCPECGHVWLVADDGPSCTACGWTPAPSAREVAVQDADLVEIGGGDPVDDETDPLIVESIFRESLGFYERRWPDRWHAKPNSGRWWAWTQTREMTRLSAQRPPSRFWNLAPSVPSSEVSGRLKARLIAWAKRQRAA
jgi:superfamily II DNA or RNA helicase